MTKERSSMTLAVLPVCDPGELKRLYFTGQFGERETRAIRSGIE